MSDELMPKTSEHQRVCKRFEIAIENFGRSCVGMRANEKCFQAWYAAAVIHEFGMSRVYREVHLNKAELLDHPEASPLVAKISQGNELFPDLSVSWAPDVDARHSAARDPARPETPQPDSLALAPNMLAEFAIVSELKITGSTSKHTPPAQITLDLAKLFVFADARRRAHKSAPVRPLSTYMVILDNAQDASGAHKNHYAGALQGVLEAVRVQWPEATPRPVIALISPRDQTVEVTFVRDLQLPASA